MQGWFKEGNEGEQFFEEEKERRKQEAATGNVKNWRFRLKKGQTGYVVFIDNLKFFMKEHQFYKDGNYYNYETCIEDIEGECPLCESGNRASVVAISTVIDLTEHQKKDGTTTGPTKKLMVLKQGGAEKFLKRQKKLDGLKYQKFEVYRSNDQKGEATGTDIDYEKEVDPEKLKQLAPEGTNPDEWIQPFNYAEIFQPNSAAELRKIIGVPEPVGSGGEEPFEPDTDSSSNNGEAKKKLADLI